MRKILYIDMDNVLVDFQSGIAQTLHDVQREYEDRLSAVQYWSVFIRQLSVIKFM